VGRILHRLERVLPRGAARGPAEDRPGQRRPQSLPGGSPDPSEFFTAGRQLRNTQEGACHLGESRDQTGGEWYVTSSDFMAATLKRASDQKGLLHDRLEHVGRREEERPALVVLFRGDKFLVNTYHALRAPDTATAGARDRGSVHRARGFRGRGSGSSRGVRKGQTRRGASTTTPLTRARTTTDRHRRRTRSEASASGRRARQRSRPHLLWERLPSRDIGRSPIQSASPNQRLGSRSHGEIET